MHALCMQVFYEWRKVCHEFMKRLDPDLQFFISQAIVVIMKKSFQALTLQSKKQNSLSGHQEGSNLFPASMKLVVELQLCQ